jgi:O-antigen/teichoic acid export membrane protein
VIYAALVAVMQPPPEREGTPRRVIRTYGIAATRDASLYGMGVGALLPFGLISLAITTRYLDPTQYGELARLMAVTSILTIVAGLGILQGTLMTVYRVGDDGVDGADGVDETGAGGDDDLSQPYTVMTDERRRLLGSGILFSGLQAGTICGLVAIFAVPLARFLVGDPSYADAVRWLAASVFTGALWRVSHQIWRMERRPVIWLWFQIARPLLVVGATVVAFTSGLQVVAPLVATTLGTLVVVLLSLVASRHCMLFNPHLRDYPHIWSRGRGLIPIQIANVVQANLGILVLGALAPAATVGVFAVAVRISMIPSFFGHGLLLAWPTLNASPIGMALSQVASRRERSSRVFSLLYLGTLGLLVAVSLGATALVGVAAPEYASAADYVPLLAAGSAGLLIFRGIYRAGSFPYRRVWYIGLHFFWVFPYVGVLVALIGITPSWAVATAELAAAATICVIIALADRFGGTPTPFRWRQLLLVTAIGGALLIAVSESPTGGLGRSLVAVVTVVTFPILLMRLKVIPRQQAEMVWEIVVGILPKRMSARMLAGRLARLTSHEREAIDLLIWQHLPLEVAAGADRTPDLLLARLTRGLRHFTGDGTSTPHDAAIGGYLLSRASNIERDALARTLTLGGADPLELHLLQRSLTTVSRLRWRGRRMLRRSDTQPAPSGLPR